ncbi:MAG TPA: response regulator [Acidobacteriota bacterium]|nr:response regulator [Acidobacteriota bacterium]
MSKKILIVDDEEDITKLVRLILEDEGYEVHAAPNGTEALGLLREELYDLVLLDLLMPGMNGWEVLKQLRISAKANQTPVILLTGRTTNPEDLQRDMLQYSAYITKPFHPDDLVKRIKQVVAP